MENSLSWSNAGREYWRRLLNSVTEEMAVLAFHFPFSGLGQISQKGEPGSGNNKKRGLRSHLSSQLDMSM